MSKLLACIGLLAIWMGEAETAALYVSAVSLIVAYIANTRVGEIDKKILQLEFHSTMEDIKRQQQDLVDKAS